MNSSNTTNSFEIYTYNDIEYTVGLASFTFRKCEDINSF